MGFKWGFDPQSLHFSPQTWSLMSSLFAGAPVRRPAAEAGPQEAEGCGWEWAGPARLHPPTGQAAEVRWGDLSATKIITKNLMHKYRVH